MPSDKMSANLVNLLAEYASYIRRIYGFHMSETYSASQFEETTTQKKSTRPTDRTESAAVLTCFRVSSASTE